MRFSDLIRKISGQDDGPPDKLPAGVDPDEDPLRGFKQERAHPCEAYMHLKMQFRDIGRMNAIIETLGRDFLTAMPHGAYQSRLGHIAFLFRRLHEDLTSAALRHLMDKAQEHEYAYPDEWDEWDRANLREMCKMYLMYSHVEPDLMEQKARLSYQGRRHHTQVKDTGDWDQAKAFLSEQIDLHRRIAEARCKANDEASHYQMLMQEYMPDMSVFEVENLFAELEAELKTLLPNTQEKQSKEKEPLLLKGEYGPDEQMWLNRSLLEVIGFDFNRGGLYETGHNPVEGGTPEDTRLVISNVDESNFIDSMKSALHEGGHGLYIQGLPRKAWRYQPVAMDLGAGIHESQALLIEMIIGRTPEFFEFLSPRLEGLFHGMNSPALSPENLYALKTRVKPTVYRRRADEVTYFYHILMRFRIERDLIEGSLSVDEMPQAWVEAMHDMLGILPKDHQEGCLQDVHWFVGKFGYFPSYVIGHVLAAQIYARLADDIPQIEERIAEGDFEEIRTWLHKKIYAKGRLLEMRDLVQDATGSRLDAKYLIKHLRRRYLH